MSAPVCPCAALPSAPASAACDPSACDPSARDPAAPPAAVPPAAPIARAAILTEARSWIGTPYLHRASLKGHGADCLGLVRGVWRALVGPEPESLPPYAPDWAEAGRRETLADTAHRCLIPLVREEAQPGDVLLFRFRAHLPAKHAAILSEGGRMIHAYDGASVCETHLSPWWRRRLAFAFAFPGVG